MDLVLEGGRSGRIERQNGTRRNRRVTRRSRADTIHNARPGTTFIRMT
jgi:hypothetical protein